MTVTVITVTAQLIKLIIYEEKCSQKFGIRDNTILVKISFTPVQIWNDKLLLSHYHQPCDKKRNGSIIVQKYSQSLQ